MQSIIEDMRFLLFLLFLSKAIAIGLGFKARPKATSPYKLQLIQIILLFTVEGIGLYTGIIKGQNNIWLSNPYVLVEIWLVAIITQKILSEYTKHTKWIYFLLIPVSALWVQSTINYGFSVFVNWFYATSSIVLILASTILLFHLSNSGKKIYASPDFWYAVALAISCSITIPLFGLHNYLIEQGNNELHKQLYYINQISGIIRYSLIAVSFYIIAKPTNTQPDVQH